MRSVTSTLPLPCPARPDTRSTRAHAAGWRRRAIARHALSCTAALALWTGALGAPGWARAAAAAPGTGTAVQPAAPDWLPPLGEAITRAAQAALDATRSAHGPPPRLEVTLGQLDPRLRLAPCQQVQPFWPAGQRLLGHARVGLRCTEGRTRWQVYLPVRIQVWGPALLAAGDLPAGTVLAPEHLRAGEADLLARHDALVQDGSLAVGRPLARALAGGQALRQDDLRLRQWVRPGDMVRVHVGRGDFQVSAEAVALAAALEGQAVRVRTESGRILQGVATGERQVTVPL